MSSARRPSAERPRSARVLRVGLSIGFPLLIIGGAYALFGFAQLTLPGIYMDAVNPDYLSARILNWHGQYVPGYALPGNLFFGRLPILTMPYHGTQQLWLGLPWFWLFGASVTGLRLTHMLFGLAVLLTLYALLIRASVGRCLSVCVVATLACDPSFVYAFRTQSYITLAPSIWLFTALICLINPPRSPRQALTPGRAFWCGLFLGLAIVGYFVYAFYLPAILASLLTGNYAQSWSARLSRAGLLASSWAGGLIAGTLSYWIGYGLLASALGGIPELVNYIADMQTALGAFASPLGFWARIEFAGHMVDAVITNWWNHELIFGFREALPGSDLKMLLLVAVPIGGWLILEVLRRSNRNIRLFVGMPLIFAACSVAFGNRLGAHHFVSILPLCYGALAVVCNAFLLQIPASFPISRRVTGIATGCMLATIGAINVWGEIKEGDDLTRTHGVGLYSDAIDKFAENLLANDARRLVILPDWGLMMPVAFLTRARVEIWDTERLDAARQKNCEGSPVVIALIKDRAPRFDAWRRAFQDAGTLTDYTQHDGSVVFQVLTFRAGIACQATTTNAK